LTNRVRWTGRSIELGQRGAGGDAELLDAGAGPCRRRWPFCESRSTTMTARIESSFGAGAAALPGLPALAGLPAGRRAGRSSQVSICTAQAYGSSSAELQVQLLADQLGGEEPLGCGR
jgi:hypothetical protein